jgi:hypothetical protein
VLEIFRCPAIGTNSTQSVLGQVSQQVKSERPEMPLVARDRAELRTFAHPDHAGEQSAVLGTGVLTNLVGRVIGMGAGIACSIGTALAGIVTAAPQVWYVGWVSRIAYGQEATS